MGGGSKRSSKEKDKNNPLPQNNALKTRHHKGNSFAPFVVQKAQGAPSLGIFIVLVGFSRI